ncbi:SUMO-specific isopeptidase USPL1 isoform X2 [Pteropus medius]|uniref:SUMO-specific isopeptidase USPL1 isoform X2 n=1 Tax=Pteropus vampyrus TaxID=132908 RepID=UPI00196A2E19|nr:SUMO-specific isopeptidase USPL1 isoform X2 [Pteropus giganteus]
MMDSPKTGNGLPVIGPGTHIGKSSLHMNCDSNVPSDGYCPACREKGKLKALKTYRISFQESISLCEDLQCIYPLGFKSLNNLISPDLEDHQTPNKPQKRKLLETSYRDSPPLANSKKIKDRIVTGGDRVLGSRRSGEAHDEAASDIPGSPHGGQRDPVRADNSLEQDEILEAAIADVAAEEDAATVGVSGTGNAAPQNEGGTPGLETPLESRCRPFCRTVCVQWRNSHALCWLDCLLSALVHLEVLRKAVLTHLCAKEDSVFWQLFTQYSRASELLHASQVDGVEGGDCKELNSEIFAKIEACLNEVRDEIFLRLQPQLRCTLGDMESPVFAFPLLLKLEPCIEKLFTYSFSWNFECSQCGHKYQNRCTKNLVTFTNVIPEWHPLNAAHFGPCNNCNNKSQIRKMVLEKLSPVFMLHFVEGLPHSTLQHYVFRFEGAAYHVTAVIQYQANNHFITWILDADGSWLECDDLKGLCSERHEKLEVPAPEIHIVIWERKTSRMTDPAAACLPLQKTDDGRASGPGTGDPGSPASCSVSGAASAGTTSASHPTGVSVASDTLSQNEAVTHGHRLLADPGGVIDSQILPLALEEIQVNSEGFLLENGPVAGNEVARTDAAQSQESLMASVVSAPRKEKLSQDQFADSSFPSRTVNANTQSTQRDTEGMVVATAVTDTRAADPTQGVKSAHVEGAVAPEKSVPFKQLLSPETEKLKPEQCVTLEIGNLKKKETSLKKKKTLAFAQMAKPVPDPPLEAARKKPFVGSWVQGLLSKGASFMPPCVSAHSRSAVADLQPSVKGASNFGGFKTKGKRQKANQASRRARGCASKPPPASGPPASPPWPGGAALPHAVVSTSPRVVARCDNASLGAPLGHGSRGGDIDVSSTNPGDSVEGQIHKLRLKLLKKLKAKKKKLAALMSSPQNGKLPGENVEHVSHCGSPNDGESIEDLLKELQYQIDLADNKCGGATVPGVAPYGTQAHEDILAELLSPAAVSAVLSEHGEADLRYLEVGENRVPAPVPSELSSVPRHARLGQDHDSGSPAKDNQCGVQPAPLTGHACSRTPSWESPVKPDVFDDLFSTSALNSLAHDTLDLPYFDEYLFENC